MEARDITLSIPKEVLHEVRLLAVRGPTSVSGAPTWAAKRLARQEDAFIRSRQKHLQLLEQEAAAG